ncbi:hypothetical protein [Streptomyces sp. NPDC020747]|uniref:SCO2400 family protein n=1 Tax=Streptomyces sp. NPDC020747 TaxID=3365086 RepID=UPI003794A41A
MDYCSSCRRHLNGALVCPGCGAYAPDIAPVTADGHTVPAISTGAGAAPAWEAAPADAWHDDRPHSTVGGAAITAALSEYPRTDPGDDLVTVPSAPQGRAARRRQRARWKKNQRKAVVATAVALVGGGLTVSAMDQQSGDRAQAATAPETAGTATDTDTAEKPSAPYTRPSRTRPDSGASSPTSSTPERASRQRTAAPPRSTPSNPRPDSAAPPRTTTESTPQPRTTSPTSPTAENSASDRNEAQPSQTHSPSATEPSSQPPQSSPAPTATSPSQICLLVVCLG